MHFYFWVCFSGCQGKSHRQDRHNCSFMVNFKLYLSHLNEWRVHLTGSHVTAQSGHVWQPPPPHVQRLSEDRRDAIILHSSSKAKPSNIVEVLSCDSSTEVEAKVAISKRKISKFVSSMKRRRKSRSYDCKIGVPDGETLRQNSPFCKASKTNNETTKESLDNDEILISSSESYQQLTKVHDKMAKETIIITETGHSSPEIGYHPVTHVQQTIGNCRNYVDLRSLHCDKNVKHKILDSSGNITCINTGDKVTSFLEKIESGSQIITTTPSNSEIVCVPLVENPSGLPSALMDTIVVNSPEIPDQQSSSDIGSLLARCQKHGTIN